MRIISSYNNYLIVQLINLFPGYGSGRLPVKNVYKTSGHSGLGFGGGNRKVVHGAGVGGFGAGVGHVGVGGGLHGSGLHGAGLHGSGLHGAGLHGSGLHGAGSVHRGSGVHGVGGFGGLVHGVHGSGYKKPVRSGCKWCRLVMQSIGYIEQSFQWHFHDRTIFQTFLLNFDTLIYFNLSRWQVITIIFL